MDRFVDTRATTPDQIVVALMSADGERRVEKMQMSFREASVLIGSLQAALAEADERYRTERLDWVKEHCPTAITKG